MKGLVKVGYQCLCYKSLLEQYNLLNVQRVVTLNLSLTRPLALEQSKSKSNVGNYDNDHSVTDRFM